jgi:hypothetical protein
MGVGGGRYELMILRSGCLDALRWQYQLMDYDADLQTHAGHSVILTGELKGDAIRASLIEMTHTSMMSGALRPCHPTGYRRRRTMTAAPLNLLGPI